jgi:hypothetical protein
MGREAAVVPYLNDCRISRHQCSILRTAPLPRPRVPAWSRHHCHHGLSRRVWDWNVIDTVISKYIAVLCLCIGEPDSGKRYRLGNQTCDAGRLGPQSGHISVKNAAGNVERALAMNSIRSFRSKVQHLLLRTWTERKTTVGHGS